MERNPYSPPISPVADSDPDSPPGIRSVLIACKLVWTSFGLSMIEMIVEVISQSRVGTLIISLVGAVFWFAVSRWIVSKLKARRNWMRLLMTILPLLGYLCVPIFWQFYVTTVFPTYAENPLKLAIVALQTIASIATIVMLNVPESRAWFAARQSRV